MSESNILNLVAGYQDACTRKQLLEKNGSDFSEIRHGVANTVNRLHPKRLTLRVTAIVDETPTTRTLRLQPEGGETVLPPFQAGQYVNVYVSIGGNETARPYAISSAPSQRGYYEITVKRAHEGFVSHHLLDGIAVGEILKTSGPMGSFFHNPLFHGTQLVFLAGGSGIVPARSMVLDMLDRNMPWHFDVIYGNSYENDVIFQQELRDLAARYDKLRLTELISRPTAGFVGRFGHISADLIREVVSGDLASKMYYICGPTQFNDNCLAQLAALGVPRRRIRVEGNGAPKNPHCLPLWPAEVNPQHEVTITVQGKGSFRAKAGEPLLNSLERNGYAAENACRSGECSLCRVKLLSGKVFNPPEAKLRQSDRDFGWIHSCVAFPLQDIEILL